MKTEITFFLLFLSVFSNHITASNSDFYGKWIWNMSVQISEDPKIISSVSATYTFNKNNDFIEKTESIKTVSYEGLNVKMKEILIISGKWYVEEDSLVLVYDPNTIDYNIDDYDIKMSESPSEEEKEVVNALKKAQEQNQQDLDENKKFLYLKYEYWREVGYKQKIVEVTEKK